MPRHVATDNRDWRSESERSYTSPSVGFEDRAPRWAFGYVTLESRNHRFGRFAIGLSPEREQPLKFGMRLPRYTTRIDELPVIRDA